MSNIPVFLYMLGIANAFIAGMHVNKMNIPNVTWKIKIRCILKAILWFLFGLGIYVGIMLYLIIKSPINKLLVTFQVQFFLSLWFTDKWENIPRYKLVRANMIAMNKMTNNSIGDRMYHKCVKIVNRLNNYQYDPTDSIYEEDYY